MALTTENDKPKDETGEGQTSQPEAGSTTTPPEPPAGTTPPEPPVEGTPPEPPAPEKEPEKPKKVKVAELSPLEKQEKAAIIYLARRYLDPADMQDFKNLFPMLFEE